MPVVRLLNWPRGALVLGPAIRLMLGACLRSIRAAPLFLCVLGAAAAAVGRGCGRGHTR